MEFRILGPLEVAAAGGPIRLGSRRERAVLAALVLGGGDVISADRLVDALWGAHPPRSAAKTLQNLVLRLRKALGPGVIETQAPGYRLLGRVTDIDARRFDELVREALDARAAGRPGDAATGLRAALCLWRGEPLEELDGWAAADAEARRLGELRRVAAEELVDAELACGRAATVVAELEAMVAAEPLRERRWAMLVLALYRCGRQADALRAYQRARTLLGEELGIEPGPELRGLERAVAAQDPSLDLVPAEGDEAEDDIDDDAAAPPYKGLASFEAEDQARFFGRSALVGELVARVGRDRFVAVVGPSGSGKSSVVRAGVLAALRGGALPGSETWPTLVFTPGARPLVELAAALAPVVGRTASDVLVRLEADRRGLAEVAREVVAPGAQLAVVVDQVEELFTQTRDPGERGQFVASLMCALDEVGGRVTVVLALRADFYGHAAAHPDLAAWL
ncbi:MAG TPA: BTAD domain-containing putative transcriptional regulator, partial [Acidimicrobiales bacterium]